MEAKLFTQIDAVLRARGKYTRLAIEEALAEVYTIGGGGGDDPTVEDDEFHNMITGFHVHYVRLGLAHADE